MRAHELFEDKIKEGELIPLPERVIIVPGGSYDTYQISKMFCNPYLAHKCNYEFINVGDFTPGLNPDQTLFSFNDDVAFEQAKKILDHFGVEYATAEEHPGRPNNNCCEYTDELYCPGK